MDFKFNGITPENINFNGLEVDILQYNGEVVWQKTQPQPTENVYALFDGASYFDTNVKVSNTGEFKVVCGVFLNDKPTTTQSPFGTYYSSYYFAAYHTNAAGGWRINNGNKIYSAMPTYNITEYKIEMSKSGSSGSYTITDLTHSNDSSLSYSTSYNSNLYTRNIFVGAVNGGSASSYFKQYIKYLKIYQNNVLINDFSFKEVDGVVKMYDSVNNTYFDKLGRGQVRLVNIDNKDVTLINTDDTTNGYICSVDGNNKYVPQYAFHNNYDIAEITVNADVDYIQDYAFDYCYSLRKLTLNGQTQIFYASFEGCSQLSEIVYNGNTYYDWNKEELWQAFENNGLYVDESAFNGTPFEKTREMEENEVTEWDYWNVMITYTDGSVHYFNFDSGEIPYGRFQGRGEIYEVTISGGLTISDYAFAYCYSLYYLSITTDGLSSINYYAFGECSNLYTIELNNNSVPYIDDSAFEGIQNGGTLYYCGSNVDDVWSNDWSKLMNYYGWEANDICE